ncbi:transposable element Tc3 transposase [Trichonephila clavipes]|nr:transposable element Tc3 transposase [Trichonephila clavipes]
MSACGREFHIACKRSKSSSFEAAGRRSRARLQPAKYHALNRRSRRWFVMRGILYKATLARNPRCSKRRRIDEAVISTPVAVDQRAAKCLEEAVRSFNARFVEWAQNEIAVVPDFHKRILFSDEVHFWLNGYVNKQNCRIWSEANPHVYVETPLHPEKLTVWCALWAGVILLQNR